jgi:hypothetical protein
MRSKKSFTLLELFLCLALLTLLSGVVGWQMKDVLAHHQFRNSVDRLVSRIRELQVLTTSYQNDMGIEIYTEEGQLQYKLITEEPLPIFDFKKNYPLQGIDAITLKGKKVKESKIMLFSNGRITPCETLGFHNKNQSLWVDLSSFPQIKVVK